MRASFLLIIIATVALVACGSKKTKDCGKDYPSPPGALGTPWKELALPLDGGTVCKSDKMGAYVVFSKGGNWIQTLDAVKKQFESAGWKVHDLKTQESIGGDQGGANVVFRKDDQQYDIATSFQTYPDEIWKDKPFTVHLSYNGKR